MIKKYYLICLIKLIPTKLALHVWKWFVIWLLHFIIFELWWDIQICMASWNIFQSLWNQPLKTGRQRSTVLMCLIDQNYIKTDAEILWTFFAKMRPINRFFSNSPTLIKRINELFNICMNSHKKIWITWWKFFEKWFSAKKKMNDWDDKSDQCALIALLVQLRKRAA